MTWGYTLVFAGYSGFLYQLQLASYDCNMAEKATEKIVSSKYHRGCEYGGESVFYHFVCGDSVVDRSNAAHTDCSLGVIITKFRI